MQITCEECTRRKDCEGRRTESPPPPPCVYSKVDFFAFLATPSSRYASGYLKIYIKNCSCLVTAYGGSPLHAPNNADVKREVNMEQRPREAHRKIREDRGKNGQGASGESCRCDHKQTLARSEKVVLWPPSSLPLAGS